MELTKELYDSVDAMERYLILYLGSVDRPSKSFWHLHYEMFVMSKANSKMQEHFYFMKSYHGPYCMDLEDLIESFAYYPDAFEWLPYKNIGLTPNGKELYNKILEFYKDNEKFKIFLSMIKMTRELYDKLTKEQIRLLIFDTYPEMLYESTISKKIHDNRLVLSKRLKKRGLITEKRYEELIK